MRAKVASSVSRDAAALSRAAGRGDGSVIGGWIGLKIDPDLLAHLAAGRAIALVSGTNGKTTTTRLTAAAMGVLGDVATNSLGANMPTGHTSALAKAGAHAVRGARGRRALPHAGPRGDRPARWSRCSTSAATSSTGPRRSP